MMKPVDYGKHFLIGTPLVGWKCDRGEDMTWLKERTRIRDAFPHASFFAALELDERGLSPFERVTTALAEVSGTYWTYTINDHEPVVTSQNRWIRIETGRNLVREYAQRGSFDAVLYVDSDINLTVEILEKLLEVDRPLVGVNVPEYVQSGPVVHENPRIEEHWTTAGMLLVNAPAYYELPWSHNQSLQLSDDPTFQELAKKTGHGNTWVRKDINAHHEGLLVAVEARKIPERSLG
jgi:hypothetical protein